MLQAELKTTTLPKEMGGILDIAAVDQANSSEWLILTEKGNLFRFNAERREAHRMASVALSGEPEHDPWNDKQLRHHLHVSACGRFGAVVNDYGKRGQIIDFHRGIATCVLNGGNYYSETVPFSFAFVNLKGRTLAIHRTDWNRLDISDPATGELLTARGPTCYGDDGSRPDHYLDYFHGALYASPKNTYLLSDGWVWHPVGIPTIWKLEDWYSSNLWESEDGISKVDMCLREYYWDHAICWIDERRVAIGGIGDDDDDMRDGVRVFDVESLSVTSKRRRSPLEVATIPGPAGSFFSDGASLFSSDDNGLFRWDVASGGNTGHLSEYKPTRFHRGAREFVQLVDDKLLRWRITA